MSPSKDRVNKPLVLVQQFEEPEWALGGTYEPEEINDGEDDIATIAGRLTENLSKYSLNKRDKEIHTVALFYVPDKIRDCIPFVARAARARMLPGTGAVYCCALEKGEETLKKHPELKDYLVMKGRPFSGKHKGTRHETTTRTAIEALTHDTPRERSRVIVPVYRGLKDCVCSFAGAYNVNESTAGYLHLLESLSEEPSIAEVTRQWMKEKLEMFWENVHLKTASLNLRMDIIERWENGEKKPWET